MGDLWLCPYSLWRVVNPLTSSGKLFLLSTIAKQSHFVIICLKVEV
jgi:hypothetical protein